ncbi:unnamed protein product, partial [Scytosiphon promiscuus]
MEYGTRDQRELLFSTGVQQDFPLGRIPVAPEETLEDYDPARPMHRGRDSYRYAPQEPAAGVPAETSLERAMRLRREFLDALRECGATAARGLSSFEGEDAIQSLESEAGSGAIRPSGGGGGRTGVNGDGSEGGGGGGIFDLSISGAATLPGKNVSVRRAIPPATPAQSSVAGGMKGDEAQTHQGAETFAGGGVSAPLGEAADAPACGNETRRREGLA